MGQLAPIHWLLLLGVFFLLWKLFTLRVLGNLFIVSGVLACLSMVAFVPGITMVGVGALLRMASKPDAKKEAHS